MAKGHNWSGWPGAYCLRCGAEHVMEVALAENWLSCGPGEPDVWKSDDHKKLVDLCDDFCYADMTPEEKTKHQALIQALCDKLGIGVTEETNAGQGSVPELPRQESVAEVGKEPGEGPPVG